MAPFGKVSFTGAADTPSAQSFSSISPLVVTGSSYSITQEFDISAVPGGAPQVSSHLTDIPEPGSARLLEAGLVACALASPLSRRLRG